MSKALRALVKLARQHDVVLRQSYLRVCKTALVKSGRYRHAKQMRRAKREDRFIRIRLGRVIRDIERKIEDKDDLKTLFLLALKKAKVIQKQQRNSQDKRYSWHAPEVECIGKGKTAKPYEFGCKVTVTSHINAAPGGRFVLTVA